MLQSISLLTRAWSYDEQHSRCVADQGVSTVREVNFSFIVQSFLKNFQAELELELEFFSVRAVSLDRIYAVWTHLNTTDCTLSTLRGRTSRFRRENQRCERKRQL